MVGLQNSLSEAQPFLGNWQVQALETETSEQAITASAVTGHLQTGLSAAKTEMATLRRFTADQILPCTWLLLLRILTTPSY